MRALLSAIDSSVKVVYEDQQKLNVDIQGAYYEMSDALKAASVKAQITEKSAEAHVLVRDINACVTVGPKGKRSIQTDLTSSPATVWIIDTTSSTQRQMRSLVEAYRNAGHVKVLYLVSSGFKQEQFGADRNPYGTIRAFTDKNPAGKAMLNDILTVTKKSDRPLAVTAHLYRRLMKSFGAVPRSQNLLSKSKSVHDPVDLSLGKGSEEDDRWDFDFDFNAHFEQVQARDELLGALRKALEVVPEQEDDENAHLADHSHHASEFIYAGPSSKEAASGREKSRASKHWFNITVNPGGGDCVLHALAGKTLEFQEILARRGEPPMRPVGSLEPRSRKSPLPVSAPVGLPQRRNECGPPRQASGSEVGISERDSSSWTLCWRGGNPYRLQHAWNSRRGVCRDRPGRATQSHGGRSASRCDGFGRGRGHIQTAYSPAYRGRFSRSLQITEPLGKSHWSQMRLRLDTPEKMTTAAGTGTSCNRFLPTIPVPTRPDPRHRRCLSFIGWLQTRTRSNMPTRTISRYSFIRPAGVSWCGSLGNKRHA